jgi:hypothetical protein
MGDMVRGPVHPRPAINNLPDDVYRGISSYLVSSPAKVQDFFPLLDIVLSGLPLPLWHLPMRQGRFKRFIIFLPDFGPAIAGYYQ